MASTRSRIEIEIRARVEDFRDAVRGAELQLRRMAAAVDENDKAFSRLGKGIRAGLTGLAKVGAVVNAVGAVAGLTASLSNLLGILGVAPAAIFALGAAIGTFKLATAGFSDAVGGDAEALAKLAPSARATVQEINRLKPAFDALRKSVQQEFFKNFATDLANISNRFLPILERQLPRIAAAFNAMGRSITAALDRPEAADDINIALVNTAKFLENARNAVGHLVTAFIPLIAVGSTYLPNIGRAIDAAADRFRVWSLQVTSDGSLRQWIDGAIREFGFLRDLIGNVGRIFNEVFTGLSQGAGKDFLQTMADTTQALADFLGQAQQQEALQALGKALAEIGAVTRDVFLEALRQLSPIIVELAPVFAEIARVVGALLVNALKIAGPLLLDLARFLNDNKEAIADLAPLVLGLWLAFKGAAVLTSVIGGLRLLSRALGGPIALLRGGGLIALGFLAVKINDINKETAKIENRPLNDMEDTLSDLVDAGHEILTLDFEGIFSDIGGELQQLHDGFVGGTSPIGAFGFALRDATLAARDFVVNAANEIGTFFSTTLPQKAAEVGGVIEGAMQTAATAVSDFFTITVPTLVSDFFTSIGTGISTGASNIGTVVADTFTAIGDTVKAKVAEIVQGVSDFLAQTPYQIGFAIGAAIGEMLNQIGAFGAQLFATVTQFMTDFGTAIQTGISNAVTFFAELPGKVGAAIAGLTETLASKAQEAGQAFLDWIGSFFTQTTDRASQVPGQVGGAVSGIVSTLGDKAKEAGTRFLQFLVDAWNAVVSAATTVPGRVGSAIAGIVQTLANAAIQAARGFLDGLTNGFNAAVAFVRTIPGRIASAIGNLGGLLVGAGKSLIDGLLSGIKAGYNNLISFVSGIADGIAAHKGPLSYDRIVLRPHGLALMGGLLGGLQKGYGDVETFVSGVADQLAAPFGAVAMSATLPANPPTASSLAALINSRSQNQDVVVTVLLDGEPVRATVRTAIEQADRETVRAARAGAGVTF